MCDSQKLPLLVEAKITHVFLGNWIGSPAVPEGVSFESLAKKLEGNEKTAFVVFVRSLLRWLPEERPLSVQAFSHPWVQGKSNPDDKSEQQEKKVGE